MDDAKLCQFILDIHSEDNQIILIIVPNGKELESEYAEDAIKLKWTIESQCVYIAKVLSDNVINNLLRDGYIVYRLNR